MVVKSYRDLRVWQKGTLLAKEIYRLTKGFPRSERFGLTSQIQRAAISVPSNIAEGQSRRHTGEFRQSLYHSLGSLAEVDTQLYLAQELVYIRAGDAAPAEALVVELRRMMHALVSRLPNQRRERGPLTTGH